MSKLLLPWQRYDWTLANSYARKLFGKKPIIVAHIQQTLPYEVAPKHYGIMYSAYDVRIILNGSLNKSAKYFGDSPEQVQDQVDKKLIELGYRLLTEEEAERLEVLC